MQNNSIDLGRLSTRRLLQLLRSAEIDSVTLKDELQDKILEQLSLRNECNQDHGWCSSQAE